MSKVTAARLSFVVAVITSGWALIVGALAPFGAGSAMLAVLFIAGIASLSAVTMSARRPRQVLLLVAASVLVVAHLFLWSWVVLIGVSGGP